MNGWLINMRPAKRKGVNGMATVTRSALTNVPWHYNTLYLFSLNKDVIKNKFHFYVLAQARRKRFMAHSNWPLASADGDAALFRKGALPLVATSHQPPATSYQLACTMFHIPYSYRSYRLDDANADAQFEKERTSDCMKH